MHHFQRTHRRATNATGLQMRATRCQRTFHRRQESCPIWHRCFAGLLPSLPCPYPSQRRPRHCPRRPRSAREVSLTSRSLACCLSTGRKIKKPPRLSKLPKRRPAWVPNPRRYGSSKAECPRGHRPVLCLAKGKSSCTLKIDVPY